MKHSLLQPVCTLLQRLRFAYPAGTVSLRAVFVGLVGLSAGLLLAGQVLAGEATALLADGGEASPRMVAPLPEAVPVPVPTSFTLAASVAQALRYNPRVKAYAYRLAASDAEVGIARSEMLPSATFTLERNQIRNETASGFVNTDYQDQDTDTLAVQVTQPLFAGMTLVNGYRRARLQQELAGVEKALAESKVALDVQMTFLDLVKARGDVQTLRDAVAQLQSSLEAVRAYEAVRMAPYVDVLQAEVELADARQRLVKAENLVAVTGVRLNALLGLPTARPVEYIGSFDDLPEQLPWTLEQCLERASTQRFDLVGRRKALAIAEKDEQIVTGQFLPRVELQGSYVDLDQDYTDPALTGDLDRDYSVGYWKAGISLQWRFFEGGRQYYNLQRARSESARIREELHEVADLVAAEVHTYFLMTDEARQRVAVAEKALGEAAEGAEREKVRYEARVGTVTELLDSQARFTQARSNYLQAQADYQQAVAQLLYTMSERNDSLLF